MSPRLCLITPPELVSGGISLDSFLEDFEAALSAGDVASVLLAVPHGDCEFLEAAIQALRPISQNAGAAFLIERKAELVRPLLCDGVQVAADAKAIKQIRNRLSQDMIIGADCGTSRHAAMVAGEAGCDYVALDTQEPDAIAWWAELMEIPCIAYGNVSLENVREIAALGPEFVAADQAVWQHPGGAVEAVEAFNSLLSAKRKVTKSRST